MLKWFSQPVSASGFWANQALWSYSLYIALSNRRFFMPWKKCEPVEKAKV